MMTRNNAGRAIGSDGRAKACAGTGPGNGGPAGIYVHVPFCRKKCIYCDFASDAGWSDGDVREYFDGLYSEIEHVKAMAEESGRMAEMPVPGGDVSSCEPGSYINEENRDLRAALRKALPADSVFIGGGTPSAVPAEYIENLMAWLPVGEGAEVTIEANPGTLDSEKLRRYRACGVNRVSLGVQSFQDDELAWLGRIHDAAAAEDAARLAREAGFRNLNLDLIFGFPGQTMESWERTLRAALALEPEHVSFYSLQIEEGTTLYEMFRRDQAEQIPDDLNRAMYHRAAELLEENGLYLYEISNAARRGFQCRHNLKYWNMEPYVGFGAAAHSFLAECRYWNPSDRREYLQLIQSGAGPTIPESSGYFEARHVTPNSREDSISDFLFTGLRKIDGISLSEFRCRFGEDLPDRRRDALNRFLQSGDLLLEGDRLRFSSRGLDITNYILVELI